jgi:hypothetical protein
VFNAPGPAKPESKIVGIVITAILVMLVSFGGAFLWEDGMPLFLLLDIGILIAFALWFRQKQGKGGPVRRELELVSGGRTRKTVVIVLYVLALLVALGLMVFMRR